jgi:hypothetical protein
LGDDDPEVDYSCRLSFALPSTGYDDGLDLLIDAAEADVGTQGTVCLCKMGLEGLFT